MPLFPFSPVGVEDKLNELYALPDQALALQAEDISANFKKWIKASFELDEQQTKFLNAMNDEVTTYYGQQCSLCFLNRLDISLVYPDAPTAPGYTKWTGSSSSITASTNGTGQSSVTGTLTFTLSYQ